MAAVKFIGGPLDGQVREVRGSSLEYAVMDGYGPIAFREDANVPSLRELGYETKRYIVHTNPSGGDHIGLEEPVSRVFSKQQENYTRLRMRVHRIVDNVLDGKPPLDNRWPV